MFSVIPGSVRSVSVRQTELLERYAFETIVVLSLVATDQQHFTDYNMNKGNVSTSVGNSQMQSVIHHTMEAFYNMGLVPRWKICGSI
ncbi:hypothetical protein T01_8895 [Trichinella spiralis]|uniref:Uncharacterized protein n=1 Tax=Trichinella spiralis TaxID=6334 RepID=A0A0V1AQX2_TRISP|nr:hypothetical protein T01_8895 [Trichinella spiralis]